MRRPRPRPLASLAPSSPREGMEFTSPAAVLRSASKCEALRRVQTVPAAAITARAPARGRAGGALAGRKMRIRRSFLNYRSGMRMDSCLSFWASPSAVPRDVWAQVLRGGIGAVASRAGPTPAATTRPAAPRLARRNGKVQEPYVQPLPALRPAAPVQATFADFVCPPRAPAVRRAPPDTAHNVRLLARCSLPPGRMASAHRRSRPGPLSPATHSNPTRPIVTASSARRQSATRRASAYVALRWPVFPSAVLCLSRSLTPSSRAPCADGQQVHPEPEVRKARHDPRAHRAEEERGQVSDPTRADAPPLALH
jgi:hypothetical protein